jgi:2'-5' RNA ligase
VASNSLPKKGKKLVMENKILCVMAGYDKNTENLLTSLQNKLFKDGYIGEQTKNLPHHITLGTFDISREMEIRELIKEVSNNTNPFSITFNHIGIFGESKVLFVAPDPNRALLDLKEKFEESYNWTPHTTMLIDKPEIIYKAMPLIASEFRAFEGRIENIFLYEFWPSRFICD